MQPAQLSLIPTEFPAPPEIVLAELPEAGVNDAVRLLTHLIARQPPGARCGVSTKAVGLHT